MKVSFLDSCVSNIFFYSQYQCFQHTTHFIFNIQKQASFYFFRFQVYFFPIILSMSCRFYIDRKGILMTLHWKNSRECGVLHVVGVNLSTNLN